ncbi:thioredoxin [Desulfolucanica intricata]|uniref:thioredoxin n=1 Tax=Desulfolucanica intricata TaxID=1285191 RepID=UPI00082F704D|nr:thioredoxin [Desulfolucanica intricata]
MAGTNIITTDTNFEQFQQLIKDSQVPILMYFGAEWCLPCKVLFPMIEELSSEYEGKMKFIKLDADKNQDIIKEYKVYSIPTIMIFKNGEEKVRKIGSKYKDELEKVIKNYI